MRVENRGKGTRWEGRRGIKMKKVGNEESEVEMRAMIIMMVSGDDPFF